jgi:hypothetical protein
VAILWWDSLCASVDCYQTDEDIGMGYAGFSLAKLGFAVGAVFRFKVLLAILALLLLVSVVFSLACGFNFLDTALTIMAVQTILQGSYFLGLVARAFFAANHRVRHIL